MTRHNARNERIKRKYAEHLALGLGKSETSVDKALAAIARFEESTRWKDFSTFRIEQAKAFRARLAAETSGATGRPLSKGTITATLKALRSFFRWLALERGYRRKLQPNDADWFTPSLRDDRIARSAPERPSPSLEQARHALLRMPGETSLEKRDRAVFALLLLTGVRVGALIGLKMRHVDVADRLLIQDPREVHVKFGKRISTWFLPVGADVEAILSDYVRFLAEDLLWGPDDPLFPATRMERGETGAFAPAGLERRPWRSAGPVRAIIGGAFAAQGLPEYGPHSFRKTLTRLGERMCSGPEEFKAWSQNLGHEDMMTTFRSYGELTVDRQREVIGRMWEGR